MTDQITYNFESNYQTLDVIKSATSDAISMKESLDQLFSILTQDSVYTGQAAEAVQSLHQQITHKMDNIISDLQHTQSRAVDQNQLVQDLDRSQASNILG